MRFLVDENLPPAVADVLRTRGHDTVSVAQSSQQGAGDEEIWSLAAIDARVLVTQDLDFPLDKLPHPPGLILVRVPHWFLSPQVANILDEFMDNHDPSLLLNRITVVSPGRYRMRDW